MITSANNANTYLTWMDGLYPETADVTLIDEDSPLWSVYEGLRNELPVAMAVPTSSPEPENQPEKPERRPSAIELLDSSNSPDVESPEHETSTDDVPKGSKATPFSNGLLDILVGCILSMVTVTTVFSVELVGYILYLFSACFFKMADALAPPSLLTGVFYSIFFLLYWVLALVDSILLLLSVLVAEVVGLASFILSCLLGGFNAASMWNQYIRKTCHRTRWAFRCGMAYAKPSRQFCGWRRKEEEVTFAHAIAVEMASEDDPKQRSAVSDSACFENEEHAIVVYS